MITTINKVKAIHYEVVSIYQDLSSVILIPSMPPSGRYYFLCIRDGEVDSERFNNFLKFHWQSWDLKQGHFKAKVQAFSLLDHDANKASPSHHVFSTYYKPVNLSA